VPESLTELASSQMVVEPPSLTKLRIADDWPSFAYFHALAVSATGILALFSRLQGLTVGRIGVV
jgi:hypothetical protein